MHIVIVIYVMFYCEKNHNIYDHIKLPTFDVCVRVVWKGYKFGCTFFPYHGDTHT